MDGTRFDDIARSLTANRTRRQAMKGAVAPALGGTVSRLASPAAVAASRAVVRCRYDDATKTGYDIAGRHAQTFKATQTGKLSEVKVWIDHRNEPANNFVGDYVAKIARVNEAGVPDDTAPLAEKAISDDEFVGGDRLLTFSFGDAAPTVRKGKRYAVVTSRSVCPDSPAGYRRRPMSGHRPAHEHVRNRRDVSQERWHRHGLHRRHQVPVDRRADRDVSPSAASN
jgi:hypothetical protein